LESHHQDVYDATVVELVTMTVVVEFIEIIDDDEEFVDADRVVFDIGEFIEGTVDIVELVVAKSAGNAEDVVDSDVIEVVKAGASDIVEDDVSDVDIETEDTTSVVEVEGTIEATVVASAEASDVEDSTDTVDIVEEDISDTGEDDVSDVDVEAVANSVVEVEESDEVSDVVGVEGMDVGGGMDTVLSADTVGVIEVGAWNVSESEIIRDGVDTGGEMLVGPREVVGV